MPESDEQFMQMALDLAWQGAGLASPNPMVGAVVVKNGQILGKGFHVYGWLKHAEAYALADAGSAARGATLYCNLEPCCHHGRTPPCTGAIIDSGIARAVVAIQDPDPRVSGRGIAQLREAGIIVDVGTGEARALELNETYLKYISTGQPFVHSVILEADSLDHRDARSDRRHQARSTHPQPLDQFLKLASTYDAIALGDLVSLNESVVVEAIKLKRHRPLMVLGAPANVNLVMQTLGPGAGSAVSTLLLGPDGKPAGIEESLPGFGGGAPANGNDLLRLLAERKITSLLALPSADCLIGHLSDGQIDRTTVVSLRS